MEIEKNEKNPYKFCCKKCDFYSNKKTDFARHQSTRKHLLSHEHVKMEIMEIKKTTNLFQCKKCNKEYKSVSGLWKHSQKCNIWTNNVNEEQQEQQEQQDALKSLIVSIMKENTDKIDILVNENKELKEQVKELIPYTTNTTNTTNMTNTINATQNNHFNIQVFLNEQCKDAINMSDFIKTIDVSLEQMDYTKRHGLAHGLSKTIIENLNRLSIYERPLHCTDVKRETLYIKDNDQWTKEDSREQVMKAIRSATFANYRTLKEWQGLHPGYEKDDTLTDYFLKTVIELGKSLEGIDRHIIRLLCREAYIRQALKQFTK